LSLKYRLERPVRKKVKKMTKYPLEDDDRNLRMKIIIPWGSWRICKHYPLLTSCKVSQH
jgi:hypothetical protein